MKQRRAATLVTMQWCFCSMEVVSGVPNCVTSSGKTYGLIGRAGRSPCSANATKHGLSRFTAKYGKHCKHTSRQTLNLMSMYFSQGKHLSGTRSLHAVLRSQESGRLFQVLPRVLVCMMYPLIGSGIPTPPSHWKNMHPSSYYKKR